MLPSLFASVYAKYLIILKYPSLSQAQHHTKTIAFILLSSKVIPLCSHYTKEGLVCIAIAVPSNHQPSSCSKCTRLNTHSSYDVWSISNAECKLYLYSPGGGNTQ